MTYLPSGRLIILFALIAPLFLWSGTVALVADLLLLVAAAIDARLSRRAQVEVRRTSPTHLTLGEEGDVFISMRNQSKRTLRVRITDDLSPQLHRTARRMDGGAQSSMVDVDSETWEPRLAPGEEVQLHYGIRAAERGMARLGDIHLRLLGPLGLVWRQQRQVQLDTVRVQPGLQELRRYRLLAHRNRLRDMGLRSMRQRGEGGSFESLREYIRGDDPRRLDWKATGKRGRLIVRQMEAERSQSILLAIDAGRLMTEEMDEGRAVGEGRERLDCALGAALLLAEVAAQHGDRVGLLVFAQGIDLFLPPMRAPLQRVAKALAAVQARLVEPDYPSAFNFLSRQLRRRSLLVLFTDVIDAHASAALMTHAGAATRRHLPLIVAIRNPALERTAARPTSSESEVYRRAAAEELLQVREQALATMRRAGVLVADTSPHDAVPTVVNRYLEVKRRGML